MPCVVVVVCTRGVSWFLLTYYVVVVVNILLLLLSWGQCFFLLLSSVQEEWTCQHWWAGLFLKIFCCCCCQCFLFFVVVFCTRKGGHVNIGEVLWQSGAHISLLGWRSPNYYCQLQKNKIAAETKKRQLQMNKLQSSGNMKRSGSFQNWRQIKHRWISRSVFAVQRKQSTHCGCFYLL